MISFHSETIVPSDDLWEAIQDDLYAKAKTALAGLESIAKEHEMEVSLELRQRGSRE